MAFIGNTVTTQGFIPAIDYFSGNGSTTAFTLSRPVASAAQVQAVIENVPQNPGSAFTVSGNTITFTSAPPSGTNNIYVYYTSPITQVIQPGQGTVGQTQMANPTGTGNPVLQTSPIITSPTMTGAVVSAMASSVITSGTAQNSTSGTSIDFTGIPSWVKRITVMFNGVSTNGTSNILLQLGSSSGGFESTGYTSGISYAQVGNFASAANSTAGILCTLSSAAANTNSGHIILTQVSGNIWVASVNVGTSTTYNYFGGGTKTLSSTLDRVRITTVNGTDTFDAGSINILYE